MKDTRTTIFFIVLFLAFPFLCFPQESRQINYEDFLKEYYLSSEKKLGYSSLLYSIHKNYRDISKKLIEIGEDPNKEHVYFAYSRLPTPFILAITKEDAELVELMLRKGAKIDKKAMNVFFESDPKATAPWLISPLYAAVISNKEPKITEMLFQLGADPYDYQISRGLEPSKHLIHTPIAHVCFNLDIKKFQILYRDKSQLTSIGLPNHTLLTLGAKVSDSQEELDASTDIALDLIDSTVSIATPYNSALISAARTGNLPLMLLLVGKGIDVNFQGQGQFDRDDRAIFAALDYRAFCRKEGRAYFPSESLEPIKFLIANGAYLDVCKYIKVGETKDPKTGKFYDEKKKLSPICYCILNKDLGATALLIQGGADLEHSYPGQIGTTALIQATEMNYYEGVKLLLEAGADPSNKGWSQESPIEIAAGRGFWEIFDLLIAAESMKPEVLI